VRIATIIGTRPEAIKMAPVIRALEASDHFTHTLIVSGQHRQLLDQVLALFALKPAHDLNIMQEGQQLDQILTRTLSRLGEILRAERPDCVLVHGDTTTTLSGALAGFYNRIPVGHVEAGLRTADRFLPYPEEMNRRLADELTDYYFCPTPGAAENLRREGLTDGEIIITGNTVVDAVNLVLETKPEIPEAMREFIDRFPEYVVVTAHRRENWGEPLRRIGGGIAGFAQASPQVGVIICLHPNPVLREGLEPLVGGLDNVLLTPACAYASFVHLMHGARFILTDSGGIQEEACGLAKFVLVMRERTERPEAVEAGFARVIGTAADSIVAQMEDALAGTRKGDMPPADTPNPFGDGHAAELVAEFLQTRLGQQGG
jgi:UDP-N-acetylglucosamine 2-epimerase (non-hydrolysing)